MATTKATTLAQTNFATTSTKLDDFGTPDDNTDLNASTSRHGLLPKFPNNATYLKGDGTWTAFPDLSVYAPLSNPAFTGNVLKSGDPCFHANASGSTNTLSANSNNGVAFGTEVKDEGSDYASNAFTAPVDGLYQLQMFLRVTLTSGSGGYLQARINTSNRLYYHITGTNITSYIPISMSVVADMETGDTASIDVFADTVAAIVHSDSYFSGFLIG